MQKKELENYFLITYYLHIEYYIKYSFNLNKLYTNKIGKPLARYDILLL